MENGLRASVDHFLLDFWTMPNWFLVVIHILNIQMIFRMWFVHRRWSTISRIIFEWHVQYCWSPSEEFQVGAPPNLLIFVAATSSPLKLKVVRVTGCLDRPTRGGFFLVLKQKTWGINNFEPPGSPNRTKNLNPGNFHWELLHWLKNTFQTHFFIGCFSKLGFALHIQ